MNNYKSATREDTKETCFKMASTGDNNCDFFFSAERTIPLDEKTGMHDLNFGLLEKNRNIILTYVALLYEIDAVRSIQFCLVCQSMDSLLIWLRRYE